MSTPTPPKLAERLLRSVVAPDRLDDVLGDLEEGLHQPRRFPRLWYWRQTLGFATLLVPRRVTRRRIHLRFAPLETVVQDIRYAARRLLKRPGFTAVVIATLALGIGANTAIFTVVNGVVLRPLPYAESERLVALCETHERVTDRCVASPTNVHDWSERATTVEDLGIARGWPFTLRGDDGNVGVRGGLATPGVFRALKLEPYAGRLFRDEDTLAGNRNVVVASYAFWESELGGEREAIGRSLVLDGEPFELVGVLAPDDEVPTLGFVELFKPLPFDLDDEENRDWRGFLALGRLAGEQSLQAARSEMATIAATLVEEHPEANREWGFRMVPLRDEVVGSAREPLFAFLGAVALVLLIGCVNVASLMTGRATERERELAVSTALGASRGRVVRQLMSESLLLAVAGGFAGLILGTWAVRVFVSLAPSNIPRLDEISLDSGVLVFTLLTSIATAFLFGLAPALRGSGLSQALVSGARELGPSSRRHAHAALVVTEIALAVALLAGAGLLIRSFETTLRWEPGFDRANLLTFWVYTSADAASEPPEVIRSFERTAETLRSIPGVMAVGATSAGPLFGGRETSEIRIEGRPLPDAGESHGSARWYDVDPGYFDTLGLRILAGRNFGPQDHENAPSVAIVNESLAHRYWPGEDPIGKRLTVPLTEMTSEIVGVVSDVTPFVPGTTVEPEIYWPKLQFARYATYFIVRTASGSDPASIVPIVRARLDESDIPLTVRSFATMDELMARELVAPRFNMMLFVVFAAVALALAAVGTYGVLSFGVTRRVHEMGLRMSLGAQRSDILGLVLRRGVTLAVVGVVTGIALAALSAALIAPLVHGVSPTDALAFSLAAVVILVVALAACYLPARRASRLDPLVALRRE